MRNKLLAILKDKLFKTSIIVALLRGFGVLVFFGLTLFITRMFNPEEVGRYDFSRSLLLILGAFSVMGMNQSIIYFSGYFNAKGANSELNRVYWKIILMSLLFSAILFFISIVIPAEIYNRFYDKEVRDDILKTIAFLFVYSIFTINIDAFRGLNKIWISELFRNLIRYGLFFLLLFLFNSRTNGWLVDVFLFNFFILASLSSLWLWWLFRNNDITNRARLNVGFIEIVKKSYPMAISSLAFLAMQSIDVILLGKFLSFEKIAVYSVSVKITTLIAIILTAVNAIIAPKLAELHVKGKLNELRYLLKKSTRLIVALSLPVILILGLFAKDILMVFGGIYTSGYTSMLILLIGQLINTLCGSVGVYMNMTGKEKIMQRIFVISLLLNFILNIIFIPIFGIEGAALTTSISMIFWNLLGARLVYKIDRIKIFIH